METLCDGCRSGTIVCRNFRIARSSGTVCLTVLQDELLGLWRYFQKLFGKVTALRSTFLEGRWKRDFGERQSTSGRLGPSMMLPWSRMHPAFGHVDTNHNDLTRALKLGWLHALRIASSHRSSQSITTPTCILIANLAGRNHKLSLRFHRGKNSSRFG